MAEPSAFAALLDGALDRASTEPLHAAFVEAVRGVGRTAPNPPVGCVIVGDNNVIVSRGFHEKAGEAHAEVRALDALIAERGEGAARGLTAVVTLEPCAHTGKTPPCTERLIKEGIARVVVGCIDPNPRVHGKGVDALRAAGVTVDVVADPLCRSLIAPFSTAIVHERPYVVLKVATSLDGKTATATGASRYITGTDSRRLVHALRDATDSVLVGSGTAIADDPSLTVRDYQRADGSSVRDPVRVVLDRTASVPLTARVFDPATRPPLRVHANNVTPKPLAGVDSCGVRVDDHLDLHDVLRALAARGLHSALVEAGPKLAAAFIRAELVDELWWFRAPALIGGDGQNVVDTLGVGALSEMRRFAISHSQRVGDDDLLVLRRR